MRGQRSVWVCQCRALHSAWEQSAKGSGASERACWKWRSPLPIRTPSLCPLRLVICPDHGEECFRVHCVGISEPPGCLLERNGADHVDLNGTALQAQERTSEAPDAQGPGCRSGGAGVTQGKSRRACRRKSRADQRSRSESEETSSPRGEEAMEMPPPVTVAPGTVPCACPGCSNMAQPDTVYCCNDCLLRHAATAMRLLSVHKKHKPKPKKKKKKVRMKPEKLCLPKPSVQPESQLRQIIRHSLKEILWKRVCESGDLIRTENEVGKTAIRLEEEMFNLFRVTDHRYRSKYRSIMLRLKDPASQDLPDTIHIGGRIAPKTVWDYVGKLKSSVSKELCLIRFHPATWEEEGTYISLYSYFRSCGHFGVVANTNRRIKDLYLIPLSAGDPVPPRLLPLAGPGLESPRPNLLLGLVISEKQKRLPDTGELDKMREKQTPLDAPGCPSLPAAPQPKRKPPKSQLCSAAEGSPPPLLPLPEPPVLKTLSSLLPVATCSVTTPTTAVPVPLAASPVTLRPSDPASPLHFILRTLFKGTSFQAPPQDPAGLTPTPQQDRKAQAQEGASGVLLLDPIVQQFGHFMDSGPQEEEEEDDRLYNPEEGYNMQPAFDPWLAERGKWQDGGKALDASEEAAVAYDPEDETFLEAANVTVADLPNVMCADLRERPGEHTRYWPPPAWGHQRIWEDLKSSLAKAELLPQEHRALDQSQGALGTNHTSYSGLSRDPQQARHLGESSRYEALARAPWW
ncbi:Death-inducer obliterator 1 [Heterocephalus glaber]|uniref:Death-inducer obliterator 1 n=1 Tax=Heterocephalus glaber TaxID=10181 RepID=G5BDY0_HETGA|nr:Death-inducer obliterator 1 [Heterocephalus glaber]